MKDANATHLAVAPRPLKALQVNEYFMGGDMRRFAYGGLLLLTTLCSGCGTQPAVINYRETMQFGCYVPDPATNISNSPPMCFRMASYYTVTCIDNRGPNTIDFRLELKRVYYLESGSNTKSYAATHDIALPLPPSGWTNPYLSASDVVVPHNQKIQLTQPFSFIVPIPDPTDSDQGTYHPLSYDGVQGQPVLIVNESSVPPTYDAGASDADFKKGSFVYVGAPQFPPASCPP